MNILLVEDSRSSAALIIAHLKQWGHKVVLAMDGRAAIALYKEHQPDLVLMDVVMPEMDGIEATRQIKMIGGDRWVPLIIMTGLSSIDDLVKGLNAGADDYLIKPINFDVLLARINAMHRISIMHDSLFGILENVSEGIITINGQGIITAFNKAAEIIFGYNDADIIGRNIKILMPQPYRDEHDDYLKKYLSTRIPHVIGVGRKVFGRRRNGEVFPINLAVSELQCEKGNIFIGVIRDISEEETSRKEIERLALHDPLTGLPNRAYLNKFLDGLFEKTEQHVSAVFFIDLDGFKPINDQLGHEAGDQALCNVAQNLQAKLDKSYFIGRLGGDEFVVVIQDIAEKELACSVGDEIIKAISQPMMLLNYKEPYQLGASVGLAYITREVKTRTDILTNADNAMYEAKRTGKNKVVCFSC